jgi:hypothetical protein
MCFQLFELRLRHLSNHWVVAEAVHSSVSDLTRNHTYALHTPTSARDRYLYVLYKSNRFSLVYVVNMPQLDAENVVALRKIAAA